MRAIKKMLHHGYWWWNKQNLLFDLDVGYKRKKGTEDNFKCGLNNEKIKFILGYVKSVITVRFLCGDIKEAAGEQIRGSHR